MFNIFYKNRWMVYFLIEVAKIPLIKAFLMCRFSFCRKNIVNYSNFLAYQWLVIGASMYDVDFFSRIELNWMVDTNSTQFNSIQEKEIYAIHWKLNKVWLVYSVHHQMNVSIDCLGYRTIWKLTFWTFCWLYMKKEKDLPNVFLYTKLKFPGVSNEPNHWGSTQS